MADGQNIKSSIEFDVNKAVRDVNRLVTEIAKIEPTSLKQSRALSLAEKGAVQAGQATARLAGQYKNLAGELRRVTTEYNKMLTAQNKAAGAKAPVAPALALGTKSTNLLPAAQKISQNAAFSTYTSNIAVAQAARETAKQNKMAIDGLSNQRYALYDVARSWAVVSTAILGTAGAVAKLTIDYQKNFAQVARTTGVVGAQAQQLKTDLIDLTTAIPEGFAQISEIAALGGQLGIAAGGIEDFTSVTARLTATTNLSAEAAGTALGRFQALLQVPSSEFENLASSVLKVGVNSVATETQIVGIATQISSMGDFAGMSAQQIVGLSGALASVGGQPELSRGTITRTFSLMSAAVSEGGERLDKFAQVAGVSADEFSRAWGTEKFSGIFQDFLANLGTSGDQAVAVLRELGITSVRDVPLLLRLAGATDVVSGAFDDARTGYQDASELTDQYGKIAETVSAKLTMLGNTIKAIAEAAGSQALGPFGSLLNIIQGVADALLMLARNPVGQFFLGTAGAVTVLVGVLAAYRMMQALSIATMYAMTTAQQSLSGSAIKSSGALRGLTSMMAVQAVGTQRATLMQVNYNHALALGSGRAAAFGNAVKAATVGVNGFATAGKAAGRAFAWIAVLTIGMNILTDFISRNQEASAAIEELTVSLDQNTGAITRNTRTYVYDQLVKDGTIERAKRLGLSLRDVTNAALGESAATNELTGSYDGLLARITELQQKHSSGGGLTGAENDELSEARKAAEDYAWILNSVGIQTDRVADSQDALGDARAAGALEETAQAADILGEELSDLVTSYTDGINATLDMQNAIYGLGSSLAENGNSFSAYSEGGRANLESLQSVISSMVTASAGDSATLASMLQGLMNQLATYGVDAVNELAWVSAMINQLAGGKGLQGVEYAATEAGNALSQGYTAGANKAARASGGLGKSAGGAAKKIQTLSDYVSDLEGVFKAAFEFRFGLGNATDEVADAWQALRDNSDDAAESVRDAVQAIREADAEIRGLNAAQTTLEYQLKVAQEYGDILRSNEILAEMAKNQAELSETESDRADAQKDLRTAQDATSKSLSGGTEASREQRDLVEALLKSYASQVSALANTGMSQADLTRKTAELRAEFVRQMTQLGYNATEVETYARAFDDLTYAIQRVPRNITVDANTDPAVRAVEEFLAKVRASSANVSVGASGDGYSAGLEAGKAFGQGWSVGQGLTRKVKVIIDSGVTGGVKYTYDGVNFFLSKGGYVNPAYLAGGGVAGLHPGGPKGSDTTPAWLTPGEFVHNTQAVGYYGLPFMNALNNMQVPKYLAAGGPVGGSSGRGPAVQLVELLPTQLAQLAQAVSTIITLDGKVVADSVNAHNANSVRRGNN